MTRSARSESNQEPLDAKTRRDRRDRHAAHLAAGPGCRERGFSGQALRFQRGGYADLAIGVPRDDVNGHADAGAVNVLYGSPSGITAVADQYWTQDSAGIPATSEPGKSFGRVVVS